MTGFNARIRPKTMFRESFWGLNGFEELRKFIKQGNEFCKEISSIMQERADLESIYAKGLTKLGAKLNKVSSACIGSLAQAWAVAATEIEAEAELHRTLGLALHDDLAKPIKTLAEGQYKTRKPIEGGVEKSLKSLTDRRTEEAKIKKHAFTCAKEREKVMEQIQSARDGKGKATSEKDIARLEKKLKQSEETMKKADRDYHDSCIKAEQTRQEWETQVYKGSSLLQTLEEERISAMQDFLHKYNCHLSVIGPKTVQGCEKLGEAVLCVDTDADLRTIVDQKGTGPNQPEQYLLGCYAEELMNHMNEEKRRQALQNYMLCLQQDIERELKGKEGVEKLMEVYQNRPNFADADAQEDAKQRLTHLQEMINFLEASHYKISCALCEMEGRPKPESQFSQYIEHTKDKQGLPVSILRLPLSMVKGVADGYRSAPYRAPADGGQAESPSPFDDDEFDDQGEMICQARAIYDYKSTQYDELTISVGDVLNVYEKQADGWWQGELNGHYGAFPATYVQEI